MENVSITNAVYTISPITGKHEAVNAYFDGVWYSVPLDPANRHYAEIMRQVEAEILVIAEGNEPETP